MNLEVTICTPNRCSYVRYFSRYQHSVVVSVPPITPRVPVLVSVNVPQGSAACGPAGSGVAKIVKVLVVSVKDALQKSGANLIV
ncbi:MAG: hypothetical protein Q8K22_00565 [Rhodoferax sp.]|nr:hypothetical protein [Rhodoferax sp.]